MRVLHLFFLLFPGLLVAQAESRTGVIFEREITSRSALALETEYRASAGELSNGRWLFLLAGNRELADKLSITPAVRYETSDGSGPTELRLQTDLNYKRAIAEGPLTLTGRLRWQTEYELNVNNDRPENALRPRLGLEYDFPTGWTIFTEYEPRYRFDTRNEWSRLRYTLGVELKLTEQITLESFYRIEDRINGEAFRREPQIGFYLAYNIPGREKPDWEYRRPFGRDILN